MVVVLVDQNDLIMLRTDLLRRIQTRETTSDDHHPGLFGLWDTHFCCYFGHFVYFTTYMRLLFTLIVLLLSQHIKSQLLSEPGFDANRTTLIEKQGLKTVTKFKVLETDSGEFIVKKGHEQYSRFGELALREEYKGGNLQYKELYYRKDSVGKEFRVKETVLPDGRTWRVEMRYGITGRGPKQFYKYSGSGELMALEERDSIGETLREVKYRKNHDTIVTTYTKEDSIGPAADHEYEYGKHGWTQQRIYSEEFGTTLIIDRKFNRHGKVKKEVAHYDGNDEVEFKRVMRYTWKGLLKREKHFGRGGRIKTMEKFGYDRRGNLVQHLKYRYEGKKKIQYIHNIYDYTWYE